MWCAQLPPHSPAADGPAHRPAEGFGGGGIRQPPSPDTFPVAQGASLLAALAAMAVLAGFVAGCAFTTGCALVARAWRDHRRSHRKVDTVEEPPTTPTADEVERWLRGRG